MTKDRKETRIPEALSENGGIPDKGLNNWKKEKGGVDIKTMTDRKLVPHHEKRK